MLPLPPVPDPSPEAECEASARVVLLRFERPKEAAASTSPVQRGANWVRSGQRGLRHRSRGPARSLAPTSPPRSALTVAEAQRNQHDGQHDDDLGIHGTGTRGADSGGTLSERSGGE